MLLKRVEGCRKMPVSFMYRKAAIVIWLFVIQA